MEEENMYKILVGERKNFVDKKDLSSCPICGCTEGKSFSEYWYDGNRKLENETRHNVIECLNCGYNRTCGMVQSGYDIKKQLKYLRNVKKINK